MLISAHSHRDPPQETIKGGFNSLENLWNNCTCKMKKRKNTTLLDKT
jgi:hypothetical protein